MGSILQKSWNKGWLPDADETNGPPDCLLRMDNLTLDEIGAVELVNGTSQISAPGGSIINVFSKTIGTQKIRYTFSVSGGIGQVRRGATGSEVPIASGIGSSHCAFGSGFGQIFVGSGNSKMKDDGTTTRNWGVQRPINAPATVSNQPPLLDLSSGTFASWTAAEGTLSTDSSTYAGAILDSTTFRGIIQLIANKDGGAFGGGNLLTDQDTFSITVRPGDSDILVKTRVEFLLTTPTGGTDDITDYYYFEWPARDTTFYRPGINQWGKLACQRGDFTRIGKDPALNWSTIKAIRVIFFGTDVITCLFNQIWFLGGRKGPLIAGGFNNTDPYQYIQVNVFNSGIYQSKSAASNPTIPIQISNSTITLTPDTTIPGTQVKEAWFFRIGGTLPDYYFVGKCAYPGGTLIDDTSDEDALRTGILLNRFNWPVLDDTDADGNPIGIQDEILAVDGPFYGRMVILTYRNLYITNYLDPGSFDSRSVIALSANVAEKNLFSHIIANSLIVVGTTVDLYELGGTLGSLDDGTLDVSIRPMGIEQPPISEGHCVLNNTLYYVGNDGIRFVQGGQTQLVQACPRLLFKGQTRYNLSGVQVGFAGSVNFQLAANKTKIYTIVYHLDTSASVFVYDTVYQYWYRYATNPGCLFTEEDGMLLGGYSDGKLRQLETGTNFDGVQNIMFQFRTPLYDGGMPLQRKDLFVIKLVMDTGGSQVDISIADDVVSPTLLTTTSSSGLNAFYFRLDNTVHNLKRKFSLIIQDHNNVGVAKFKLTEFSIDFSERPVPVDYIRIPPTNYGTAGRKRIEEVPFIVDTLGLPINVFPILDEVAAASKQIQTADKSVATYQFASQQYATNIGLVLVAPAPQQTFEFYDMVQPHGTVDIIPDPVLYHRIPSSNLGTASRKRIFHYAFVIDTKGSDVVFIPFVDNVAYPQQIYNTTEKTTVLYAFVTEVIGVDIWGTLSGLFPFEFYGLNLEECVIEKMPPRGKHYVVPNNNFGVAAQKRIRNIPLVINTFGHDVTFIPVVDNVQILVEESIFNTPSKQTVFQLFKTDQFGVDYGGILHGTSVFEFYGFGELVDVETLPPPKMFDQVGPVQLDRSGKLLEFRVRMVARSSTIGFNVYMDDVSAYVGTLVTTPNADRVYSQKVRKSVIGTTCRIEFFSNDIFNRWNCQLKMDLAGAATDNQWMPLR